MSIKGKNKYGLKLEDFDSYEDYRKVYVNLRSLEYLKSEKGKLSKARADKKYIKTEKGRLTRSKSRSKYKKSEKGKLSNSKYHKSEKGKLTQAKYYKSEKGKLVSRILVNKRRSAKLQRTVPWSNLEEIANFYKACPKGLEVDHIIPLQGKNVSGLHVLNNLQYLTKSENASKGNRYEHR